MVRTIRFGITASLLVLLCLTAAKVRAASNDADKVIDGFLAAVQKSEGFDKQQVENAIKLVESMRSDEYERFVAVTQGLTELYPEYRTALQALGQDELGPAIEVLTKLAKSEDPYLAADASYYLAQSYALQERYEEAIPLLNNLIENLSDRTLQSGNALYLQGLAQSRLLRRAEAIATLERFLQEHPDAREAMRVAAWRHLEQLKQTKDETLTDVYDRMDFSRRHLQLEKTGEPTQVEQDKVVAILAKLIKQAEDKESQASQSQSECKKCGKKDCQGDCDGEGKGNTGGSSHNPDGVVRRTFRQGPESPWSKLRDRERDPAYSAIKEKFPARYEELIEQYYKSFQGEGG